MPKIGKQPVDENLMSAFSIDKVGASALFSKHKTDNCHCREKLHKNMKGNTNKCSVSSSQTKTRMSPVMTL